MPPVSPSEGMQSPEGVKSSEPTATGDGQEVAWITAGHIVRAHGVHGALRAVLSKDVTPDDSSNAVDAWYARLKYVRLVQRAGPQQICTLLTCRPIHGALLLTCAEIVGRDSALLWAGASLQVPQHTLPPLQDGEAYVYELAGAAVIDTTGASLGTVAEVRDNAGQPLLVIASAAGGERLLPLVAETLCRVDRSARQLTVRVPLGLWDES